MRMTGITTVRRGRFHLHVVPILVWVAALATVFVLFNKRAARFEMMGIARSDQISVSPEITGTVKRVNVELFDIVGSGDVLAVLDDSQIRAQMATVQTQITALRAELESTRAELTAAEDQRQLDETTARRRFDVDVENARLAVLEIKTQLAADEAMLRDLEMEVRIAEELAGKGAVADYELQKANVQFASLVRKIEEGENLLAQAQQQLTESQKRRDEFFARNSVVTSPEPALAVINKQIEVQQRLVEELTAQQNKLTLRAPFEGVVSRIDAFAGQAVTPALPVVTLSKTHPSEVVVYASEKQFSQIRLGMTVELIKNSEPARIAQSQVVKLGPQMELMPERLWKNPQQPQWGRPVVIRANPSLKLLGGELVGIRGL